MKKLIWLAVLAIAAIATIKYVPTVNDWARENLPESFLEIIGEDPMGIIESGMEKVKSTWKELTN